MSILNFVFEEKHIPRKPVGTKVTHSSGKTYVKESTGWYNVQTGNKLDYKSSLLLEAGENRHRIDFEEKPDGYYMNGMKLTPEQAAPFANYERFNGDWYNKKTGAAIYHEDSRALNDKAGKILKQLYKESDDKEAAKNSASEEDSTAPESQNTEQEQSEEAPKASEEPKPEDTPKAEEQPEAKPEDTSTEQADTSSIPNGYVYTSGKGNKFIFKNGTWFNLANKKPVNQSNINMLNRSAVKMIEDYNSKNEIKIGSKVSSKKGTEYTFNGTGFVSSDGKMLSGGAAQSAMNKLKAQNASNSSGTDSTDANASAEPQADDNKSEDSTIVPGESAIDTQNTDTNPAPQGSPSASTDSTDSSTGNSTDYNAQSIIDNLGDHEQGAENGDSTSGSDNSTQTPPAGSSTDDSSNDPLTKLAQQIKANKYNKQIVTLLSRGSDMDVLAADILLNGNVQDVVSQLKSLNNSNTQ